KRRQESCYASRGSLLVAKLLEDVGEEVPGDLGLRLSQHALIQDLRSEATLAFVVQFAGPHHDLIGPTHHLDIEGSRVGRRKRYESGRIAIPEAQITLDHASAVVLGRAVVAAAVPLFL